MKLAKSVKHCRIDKPGKFKLADFDPAKSFGLSTDIEALKPGFPKISGKALKDLKKAKRSLRAKDKR
jgi:hypothetical protein